MVCNDGKQEHDKMSALWKHKHALRRTGRRGDQCLLRRLRYTRKRVQTFLRAVRQESR